MLQVPISSGREGGEEEGTAEVEVEVEVEVGKVLAAHCAMCALRMDLTLSFVLKQTLTHAHRIITLGGHSPSSLEMSAWIFLSMRHGVGDETPVLAPNLRWDGRVYGGVVQMSFHHLSHEYLAHLEGARPTAPSDDALPRTWLSLSVRGRVRMSMPLDREVSARDLLSRSGFVALPTARPFMLSRPSTHRVCHPWFSRHPVLSAAPLAALQYLLLQLTLRKLARSPHGRSWMSRMRRTILTFALCF
jgi:hypothetical protein